ncbi:hypothetical protein EP56_05560 [Listeriaceae bacterium FSL A5-0209]|nr:hypothetical protein EP56_05560 [Listeriaceae bacterium FSL A5-0209]
MTRNELMQELSNYKLSIVFGDSITEIYIADRKEPVQIAEISEYHENMMNTMFEPFMDDELKLILDRYSRTLIASRGEYE